jgi:hypothetical protein
MARSRSTFRQRDVDTLVRVLQQRGLHVTAVKITPEGEILATTSEDKSSSPSRKNPLDYLYENPPDLRPTKARQPRR